jgi:hypothetical protein
MKLGLFRSDHLFLKKFQNGDMMERRSKWNIMTYLKNGTLTYPGELCLESGLAFLPIFLLSHLCYFAAAIMGKNT